MSEQQTRLLTQQELAAVVKILLVSSSWSQEQLAEISSLSVRTIQGIEFDVPSSFSAPRALAKAFRCEDIAESC